MYIMHLTVILRTPYLFEEHTAGKYLTSVEHQLLQQGKLDWGKLYLATTYGNTPADKVDLQVSAGKSRQLLNNFWLSTAKEHTHPR